MPAVCPPLPGSAMSAMCVPERSYRWTISPIAHTSVPVKISQNTLWLRLIDAAMGAPEKSRAVPVSVNCRWATGYLLCGLGQEHQRVRREQRCPCCREEVATAITTAVVQRGADLSAHVGVLALIHKGGSLWIRARTPTCAER